MSSYKINTHTPPPNKIKDISSIYFYSHFFIAFLINFKRQKPTSKTKTTKNLCECKVNSFTYLAAKWLLVC